MGASLNCVCILFTNSCPEIQRHVKLMLPSLHCLLHSRATPPSANFHLVCPNLTLAPAADDDGEFVAFPLDMKTNWLVVELRMPQAVLASCTRRNLRFPSFFLKTGRPELHLPTSNLLLSPIFFVNLNSFGQ